MRPLTLAATSLASLLALSACADGALTRAEYVSPSYDRNALNYAASKGGLYTRVIGNPFESDKHNVDDAVAQTFSERNYGPKLEFFTEPREDYDSPYQVVVLFDAARSVDSGKLCLDPNQPTAGGSEPGIVLVSFCGTGGSLISSTAGSLSGIDGPQDPRFKQLFVQIRQQIFPPNDLIREKNDNDFEL